MLQQERKTIGHNMVSWPNLPRLYVNATSEEDTILESADRFNNAIGITVESVYNAPKNHGETANLDAIFPLPAFGEVKNITFGGKK